MVCFTVQGLGKEHPGQRRVVEMWLNKSFFVWDEVSNAA